MRRLRIVIAAGLVIAAVAPALALSPPDQYSTFGHSSVTITDVHTHLEWQRDFGPQMPWANAKAYCAALVVSDPPNTITGFRLPTYKELLTLVDENPNFEGELKAIDPNAFPQTPAAYFWTSTSSPDGFLAWRIRFDTGVSALEPKSSALYVRCVRP